MWSISFTCFGNLLSTSQNQDLSFSIETDVLSYCHRDGKSCPATDFEVDLSNKYTIENQYCIYEKKEIFL